jgi:hypothetical protein
MDAAMRGGEGGSRGVGGVGDDRDYAGHLIKAGAHAGYDAIDCGVEEKTASLIAKAAAQIRKRRPPEEAGEKNNVSQRRSNPRALSYLYY